MEETWSRLTAVNGKSAFERPLRGLIADELAGWRPSLVFTPMLVEDGRQLLISNLDLSFVARNYGRMILEQDSRKLDPSYKVAFGPRFVDDDDILSLSAVEFYRLFPQAWDFRVSTAVRMSTRSPGSHRRSACRPYRRGAWWMPAIMTITGSTWPPSG